MESSQPITLNAPAKYRFLAKLGEGGMAEVYVGVLDQTAGFRKLLVLKLLRPFLAEEADGVAMFLDEARLAARLSHRNIVQTYEVGHVDDRHAIIMEFLEGATLSRLRRLGENAGEPRGLPLADGLYVLCEALSGLHYAHELTHFDGTPLGFVHRDFTPANLMVTIDGQVKVLDFGVAKTRANVAHTRTGTIKGTTRYMAREAVLGGPVDRRTDVYMAGAVLWQLVTGQRPWDGREDVAILAAILEKRLEPVRTLDPSLPAQLEAILLRATDPSPATRYQSAQELRDALLSFMRDQGLASDPDRLAALVARLAGPELAAQRRRIDDQLARPAVEPTLAATALVPSLPGLDGSGSRIRATSIGERTLSRLRRSPWLVSGIALVAMGLGVSLALTPKGDVPRTATTDIQLTVQLPAAAPVHAATVELPPRAPAPSEVRDELPLHLETAPSSARLFLDGLPLADNPVDLMVRRDDALHELRAESAGYVTKVVQVRFGADARIALTLEPDPASTRRVQRHERRALRKANEARRAEARKAEARKPRTDTPHGTRDAATPSGAPGARSIDTESPFRR